MTVEQVLRRQAGVISRAQAVAEGLSSATISRRVARGLWVRPHPRVYFAADRAFTDEARVRAAYLWAGQAATLSGVAAAWWHGLWPEPPGWVEITVPHRRRLPAVRGVRGRRSDLDPVDRVQVSGLWATAVPLTALEAAVALGAAGSRLLDRALQRRVSVAELYAAHHRNLGRRGSADVAELLRATRDRTASEAERLLVALLRQSGLTGWLTGYRVDRYELDVSFLRSGSPSRSTAGHGTRMLSGSSGTGAGRTHWCWSGWTVLRFTWHDLTSRSDAVIAEIRLAIGRPAA